MNEEPQNNKEEVNPNNQNTEKKERKFFKKVWYSITKLEKYPEMATEGVVKAIKYIMILVMILSCISSLETIYKTDKEVKYIAGYIQDNAPEFTYNNGNLDINSEEPIIVDEEKFGKAIIDTKTEDEKEVNKYIENTKDDANSIIILKDKVIIKREGIQNSVTYSYEELLGKMGITEFNKQVLVDNLVTSKLMPIYVNLFVSLFVYSFVIYLINTLINVVSISIFGYLAALILRLKLRYAAVFNMAAYSITLPIILEILYVGVNAFVDYTINYFNIMYILVASIYMIASIFILKLLDSSFK